MYVQSAVPAALPDHRPERLTGPCVERLLARLRATEITEHHRVVEEFWRRAETAGTPLVETVEGHPDHRIVTFLWRGHRATRQVLFLANGLTDRDHLAGSLMDRVPGTDVWHLGLRLRVDHRGAYRIAADVSAKEPPEDAGVLQARLRSLASHAARDPLNRHCVPTRWGAAESSVLALPDAPAEAWAGVPDGLPAGRVERHRAPAAALGGPRDVWVYLPPGHRDPAPDGDGGLLPVLVLGDGDMWFGRMRFQHVLDALVARGLLPPLAVLAPDAVDRPTRARQLGAHDAYVEYLADELLPWAWERWPVTADPGRTVVAGQGLGAMAALHAGRLRPDCFGHVVAQSPSLWWRPGTPPGSEHRDTFGTPWMVGQFASGAPRLATVHLDVGLHEGAAVDHCRALYDTLHSVRCAVTRREFNGGPDHICWQQALADRLVGLLGPAH
ncbi:enterochelin esterase [Streptomyces sp. SID5785]|uniref:enterochelin esterase n=1 Tax=Streptomyces sp. SID5785 TaxID=2690309 RepID=UPI0013610BBD|nr:enterochelin esterase [Streptomyces sp. SID5785]MZD08671.1 enterochelin esterase [Streptomyces sp. SID5785]